jgi:hypothetical protein
LAIGGILCGKTSQNNVRNKTTTTLSEPFPKKPLTNFLDCVIFLEEPQYCSSLEDSMNWKIFLLCVLAIAVCIHFIGFWLTLISALVGFFARDFLKAIKRVLHKL